VTLAHAFHKDFLYDLALQNAVAAHASARAFFVRRFGQWPPPRELELPTDLLSHDGEGRG
jgi:hypothetical protein